MSFEINQPNQITPTALLVFQLKSLILYLEQGEKAQNRSVKGKFERMCQKE